MYSTTIIGSNIIKSDGKEQYIKIPLPLEQAIFGPTNQYLRRDTKNLKKRKMSAPMCFEVNGKELCTSLDCDSDSESEDKEYDEDYDDQHCECEVTIDGEECESCTVCDAENLTFAFDCPSVGAHLEC